MADKLQLVPQDGSIYQPTEDPPQYAPVAHQQQTVVVTQPPVFHQQGGVGYAPPAMQYPGAGYIQQQPAGIQYAQPQGSGQTVVVTPGAQTIVVVPPRPPTYMWVACVVFWFCNPVFGGIAFIFSVLSASAADDNDNKHAGRLGKVSLWISVAGIFVLVLGVVIVVALVARASKEVADDFTSNLNNNNDAWNKLNNDINDNLNNANNNWDNNNWN